MTRITRYVVSELLKVFLVTLTGMTVVMLVAGVAHEAIRQGLGIEPVARLLPYALPNALRFAVPGTILFAVCSVFGRMSAGNEITALKSLGISPIKLIVPALVLAFLISLVGVWLNDLAVTWGRKGMQRVVLQSIEQIAYGLLRTRDSYSHGRFSITVKRVEGRTLILPTICIRAAGDEPATEITALEAELRLDPDEEVLSILLTDGQISVDERNAGKRVTMVFPDTIEHEISLADASQDDSDGGSPSNCPLWRIPSRLREEQAHIIQLRCSMATDAAYQMMTGQLRELTDPGWQQRERDLQQAVYRVHRLETEPWRRWAMGFSCLFFVMAGAPLAIRLRSADLWSSFALCFLPILIVYYPLLAFGLERAKSGDLPPYSVWLGNLILGLAGLWQLRRALRN
jgi:lipopolysaccharide export system permease protein